MFRPLAARAGSPIAKDEFSEPNSHGLHLIRVQLADAPDGSPQSEAATQLWLDEEGLHAMLPGGAPSEATLDELTRLHQQNIRNSPMWDEMVREFGLQRAEALLKQCRAELR